MFGNLHSYAQAHTFSGNNVAQGMQFLAVYGLCRYSREFDGNGAPNESVIVNKKLSYCWETVRRESMPRIAEMDVEMTT